MTNAKGGKKGVPAIVYLTSEPLSLSCSMRIFHKSLDQVAIALHVPVTLYGAEGDQTFVVQYDADNLQPNTVAFDSAAKHIPGDRLREIARHAEPQVTTLSLSFKHACPIWCPRREIIAPSAEADSVVSFNQLVELAKATAVHLVFDYQWIHGDVQAVLERLVKGKQRLASYPLDKYYAKRWDLKDWTVFAPAIGPSTDAEPSHKRARQVPGSTSPSPPPKRQALDDAPSPTELASSPPAYATPNEEHDFQTQAISASVHRHLPAVLKQVLPEFIPALFALPPTFSTSFDSDDSQPQLLKLTPLGASLVPHLVAHVKPQLQAMHTKSLFRTKDQREQAALQFETDVDDKKAELHQITEQGLQDLVSQAGYALDKVRSDWPDVVIEVGDEMWDKLSNRGNEVVRETLDRLTAIKSDGLELLVRWELARQQSRAGVDCRCTTRARRSARSVGKGGYKGLGDRWRKAPLAL